MYSVFLIILVYTAVVLRTIISVDLSVYFFPLFIIWFIKYHKKGK